MTYLYVFNIKINKQAYNKNLYKFCEYYKDIIFAITYEVKKRLIILLSELMTQILQKK